MYHPDDLPFELEQLPDVFTRFRGKMEKRSEVRVPLEPEPVEVLMVLASDAARRWPHLGVEAKAAGCPGCAAVQWRGQGGLGTLDHYFWETKKLRVYKKTRNGLLGADYSSKFSPWLALGCISPREIHAQVRAFEQDVEKNEDTYWLIFELIWRDYFRYVAMRYGNRIFHKRGIKPRSPKWRTGPPRLRGLVRGPDEVRFRERQHAGARRDGLHVQPRPPKRGQLPRARHGCRLALGGQLV